jgi:hypothetical protein
MNAHINFMPLFDKEPLRPDGTNFIDWYQRLRNTLLRSNALFMIVEPLGPRPGIDMDQAEEDGSMIDGTIIP